MLCQLPCANVTLPSGNEQGWRRRPSKIIRQPRLARRRWDGRPGAALGENTEDVHHPVNGNQTERDDFYQRRDDRSSKQRQSSEQGTILSKSDGNKGDTNHPNGRQRPDGLDAAASRNGGGEHEPGPDDYDHSDDHDHGDGVLSRARGSPATKRDGENKKHGEQPRDPPNWGAEVKRSKDAARPTSHPGRPARGGGKSEASQVPDEHGRAV